MHVIIGQFVTISCPRCWGVLYENLCRFSKQAPSRWGESKSVLQRRRRASPSGVEVFLDRFGIGQIVGSNQTF